MISSRAKCQHRDMSNIEEFDVTIPSETSHGREVQEKIVASMEARGFSPRDVFGVRLALEEALVNAIKHGNGGDREKRVFVQFTVAVDADLGGMAVTVRDEGRGFDPDALPDPLSPENLLKSSGRGIFLMRNFMDDVSIVRRPEGGTVVRMSKKLN